MFVKAGEKDLLKWARQSSPEAFARYLVSGTVHGKPGLPTAEMSRVEKIIIKNFPPDELRDFGKKLLRRPEYTARSAAVSFLVHGWPADKDVPALLFQAADDEDWIVREVAAGGLGSLLRRDFKKASKIFLSRLRDATTNVKRALALAVKYDARGKHEERTEFYFRVIEALLPESDEYIRKNLGPFAVGDGLLSHFPDETLKRWTKWAKSKDPWTRWNAAMVFTAATARRHGKTARKVLEALADDPEKSVRTAAKKALKNIEK